MNIPVLIGGLVELVISIVVGLLVVFLSLRLFMSLTRDIEEMEELKKKNTAVGILLASVIFAVGYQMVAPVENAYEIISMNFRGDETTFLTYLSTFGIMVGHLAIAGIVAFFGVILGMRLFMWMTRDIDEMKEIRENNIAVALIIAAIIITIALILKPGVEKILDSLIPFPKRGIAL